MLEDTVLVGGGVFLALAGLSWLAVNKITASNLSDRTKRMLIYALMGCLAAVAIMVFSWHSQSWKEKHANTAYLERPFIQKHLA